MTFTLMPGRRAPRTGWYRMVQHDRTPVIAGGRFVDRWVEAGDVLPPTVTAGIAYVYVNPGYEQLEFQLMAA